MAREERSNSIGSTIKSLDVNLKKSALFQLEQNDALLTNNYQFPLRIETVNYSDWL